MKYTKRTDSAKKDRVCLAPGCNERPIVRGLCQRCYLSAKHLIRTGKTSWEHLEAIGLAGPGRQARLSALSKAFAKLTKQRTNTKG